MPPFSGGFLRSLFPFLGVDDIPLVVLPVVKNINTVPFFQESTIQQGGNKFSRLSGPAGVQGDIRLAEAGQYAAGATHGSGQP